MDQTWVAQVCAAATASPAADVTAGGGGVVAVVTDPLDGSVWVRLRDDVTAGQAFAALTGLGLAVVERRDDRMQVTGWDLRLLRRRLGTVLAGVDDLQQEWDATAELARYFRDRRREVTGRMADPVEVLAEVERALRAVRPLPHLAPQSGDADTLLQLIEAAEDAYAQLIARHVEHAGAVLDSDAAHSETAQSGTTQSGTAP